MKRITTTAELITEEEGGYTVYCPELDTYTRGDDIEDTIKNLKQAAELHIEELGIEFKLGASPSSSLCHCQALTLSPLRGTKCRSNLQEYPTTGIATPSAGNDRKRGTASHCHCEYKEGREIPQSMGKELLKTFTEGVK